eukprot:XP_011529381.1 uncharacterized protein LOC105373242 isoform X2 [Homo sapiens]
MRTQSRVEELSFAAACCVPSQEPAPAFNELNGWEYGESYKGELWDAVRTYTWGFFVLHERHRKGRSSRSQEASLGELQGQLGRAGAQTAAPAQTPGMGKAVVRAEVGRRLPALDLDCSHSNGRFAPMSPFYLFITYKLGVRLTLLKANKAGQRMGPPDRAVGVWGGGTWESRGGLWLQQLKGQEVKGWGRGLPCRILHPQGSHHFYGRLQPSEVMPARPSLQTEFQTLRARRNRRDRGVYRCPPPPATDGETEAQRGEGISWSSTANKFNLFCHTSVELLTQTNILWTPKWPCPAPSASSSVAFIILRAPAPTALGSLDQHHGHHTDEIPRHSGATSSSWKEFSQDVIVSTWKPEINQSRKYLLNAFLCPAMC